MKKKGSFEHYSFSKSNTNMPLKKRDKEKSQIRTFQTLEL
jgi:hypothetical protein